MIRTPSNRDYEKGSKSMELDEKVLYGTKGDPSEKSRCLPPDVEHTKITKYCSKINKYNGHLFLFNIDRFINYSFLFILLFII